MSADKVTRVPTAQVLRNRGVPVRFHTLTATEGATGTTYSRAFNDEDEPLFEEMWLAMSSSVLADMEDLWGDMDGWENALNTSPNKALTTTIALAFEWFVTGPDGLPKPDNRRAGKAMIDGQTAAYSTAVGAAFMIAQGFPVEKAGEVLAAGLKDIQEGNKEMSALDVVRLLNDDDESDETTPTSPAADTPGPSGTDSGSSTDETPTSSGD